MKYNFTISDFIYTRIPEQNMTFEELSDEAFYQINRDFYLYYDFQNMTLGENPKFIVEKLKTFRSGLCYKITPTYFPSLLKSEWQYFSIGFNTGTYGNLSLEDVPKVHTKIRNQPLCHLCNLSAICLLFRLKFT